MSSLTSTTAPFPATFRSSRRAHRLGDSSRPPFPPSPALSLHAANLRLGDAPDYFSGIWTPDLLDHLSEPLTRYHE